MSKSTCELITMQNYDILPFRVSLLEYPVLNCSELFRIVLICSELFSSAPDKAQILIHFDGENRQYPIKEYKIVK